MSPVTHFFAGWVLACVSPVALTRREKALVVAAAVAPDLDGLGLVPELLTRHSSHPLLWFSEYHHQLHTLAFAIVCTICAFVIAGSSAGKDKSRQHPPLPRHPWTTALLVFVSFHLHLLCDLAGARGPDGYQWPIPYLAPFSDAAHITWNGQWILNGWQNFVFTGVLLATTFRFAWKTGSSPIELVSVPANYTFVQALRQRIPLRDQGYR